MSVYDNSKALFYTGGTLPVGGASPGDLAAEIERATVAETGLRANAGKSFRSRADAVSFGQTNLPASLGVIVTLEGDYQVIRGAGHSSGEDNLFSSYPYWSVIDRILTRNGVATAISRNPKAYGSRASAIADAANLTALGGSGGWIQTSESGALVTRFRGTTGPDPLFTDPVDVAAYGSWGVVNIQDSATVATNLAALQGVVDSVSAAVGEMIGYATPILGSADANSANMFAFVTPVSKPGFLNLIRFSARKAGLFRVLALTRSTAAEPVVIKRWVAFAVSAPGVIEVPVSMPVEVGELLAVGGWDATARVGYTPGSAHSPHIPWYGISKTTLIGGTGSVSHRMEIHFEIGSDRSQIPMGSIGQDVRDVLATFAGAISHVEVKLGDVSGGFRRLGASLPHPLAAPGTRRYDLIVLDRLTDALAVVQGTATDLEAEEAQPNLFSSQVAVARLVVGDTGILSIEAIGPKRRGLPAVMQASIDDQIYAAQRGCPRFMKKVRSGAPIVIASAGDSIQQQKGENVAVQGTVNGADRDAPTNPNGAGYLKSGAYSAEFLNRLPLYTSVQLGRADDGAGAIHAKVGMIWELVKALERQGRVLGVDLRYDNTAVGGTASSAGWVTATDSPSAWTQAVAALNADLVVIGWGMNERGSDQTESRLIKIGAYLQSQGADVLFLECPRPKTTDLVAWRYTNAAIRRAAAYLGTGAIPLSAISEDSLLGHLGVNADDICSANNSNHPGPLELTAYGRLLARIVE